MKIKWSDSVLFLIPILIAVITLFNIFDNQANSMALIIVDGEQVKTIDLSKADNDTIDLKLKFQNIIEIKDGKVGISHSNCPDKICQKSGFISKFGQVIICVPSKLVIKIIGKSKFDVISGCIPISYLTIDKSLTL